MPMILPPAILTPGIHRYEPQLPPGATYITDQHSVLRTEDRQIQCDRADWPTAAEYIGRASGSEPSNKTGTLYQTPTADAPLENRTYTPQVSTSDTTSNEWTTNVQF